MEIYFQNPAYKLFLKLMKTAWMGWSMMNYPFNGSIHRTDLSSYRVVLHLMLRRNFSSLISV